MKRFLRPLLLMLMALVLFGSSISLSFGAEPPECSAGYGDPISSIGSRSQTSVHYKLFMKKFHSPANRRADGSALTDGGCRDDTQGLVTFFGQSDTAVISAILFRQVDSLQNLYLFYGLGRPLSSVEKNRAETQFLAGNFVPTPYPILHLPLWVEPLGVAYNVDCPTGNEGNRLVLTSTALSQIFSGVIKTWSHAAIAATNLDLDGNELNGTPPCDQTIRVAVRAEQADQTTVFKDYLSKQNPQWSPLKEPAVNTQWPSTLIDPCRGRTDLGMATCVAGQSGSLAYVALSAANEMGVKTAAIINKRGSPMLPSLQGCTAAAASPTNVYPETAGDWSNVSITDSDDGYPICSFQYGLSFQFIKFSYLQSREDVPSVTQARTVNNYLKWSLLPRTQEELPKFGFAPLPAELANKSRAGAESIKYSP